MYLPQMPNQRWSLDFLSDALSDGKRFRILAVVDDFSREHLALGADTSLCGAGVARELEGIMTASGRPLLMVSDNGTELTSMSILGWCQQHDVDWHYIAPGKPQQNGFVEASSGACATNVSMKPSSAAWPMRDRSWPPSATNTTTCGRTAACVASQPPRLPALL